MILVHELHGSDGQRRHLHHKWIDCEIQIFFKSKIQFINTSHCHKFVWILKTKRECYSTDTGYQRQKVCQYRWMQYLSTSNQNKTMKSMFFRSIYCHEMFKSIHIWNCFTKHCGYFINCPRKNLQKYHFEWFVWFELLQLN